MIYWLLMSATAYAQAAPGAPQPSLFESMMPIIFILFIAYILMIRPQQKRHKVHQDFLGKLKRGDNVLTSGGVFGVIEGLTERFVTLEVSDGVRIRILKNQIASSVEEDK